MLTDAHVHERSLMENRQHAFSGEKTVVNGRALYQLGRHARGDPARPAQTNAPERTTQSVIIAASLTGTSMSRRRARRPRRSSGFRFLLAAVLAVMAITTDYLYELDTARPAMTWMGIPRATGDAFTWARVLRNPGFMLGWSDLRGNALWVTYRLTALPTEVRRLPRPERFSADWRAFGLIHHDSYTRSGYDRGHLAPNHAMAQLYGRDAQHASFRMTNISPQRSNLNQRVWQRLEQYELSELTARFGEVWVTTGPVFSGERERLRSHLLVEIPDAFYKLFAVTDTGGSPRLFAFLIPQQVHGDEPLARYVVSVDEVEKLTGLDFFHALEDPLENRLEAAALVPPGI